MIKNIGNIIATGAIALCAYGCDNKLESHKNEASIRLNTFGDRICEIVDETGKKVQKLCSPKPFKVEVYQKMVGGGYGAHTGGFGYTPNNGTTLHSPGISHIPQKQVTCTKTTHFDQTTGQPLTMTENCTN